MKQMVRTAADAKTILDDFNGFHDGFIKQLSVISHDVFEARGVQASSERLTLKLTFAHYNYEQDRKSADQIVIATFYGVMNLAARFSGLMHEWTVYELFITDTRRALEDERQEACLEASLLQSKLTKSQEWQRYKALTFSFTRAEFEEA